MPDCAGPDVAAGLDSDADGTPDSVFTDDADDLLLHTDLDADGYGDQVLRMRPDGSTSVEEPDCHERSSLEPASAAGWLVDMLARWWRG